jgi:calcineurin-like phosphoesterase family protein
MSVFFIGDPHLGHRNIAKFRPFVTDCQDNTDKIVRDWKARVNKRGIVYIMGDAAFTDEALDVISWLPGKKILIKGNHDDMVTTLAQTNVFAEIYGMLKYKGMWLTHSPMHPDELRGKPNVHGHVHSKSIMRRNWYGRKVLDRRYLNTCVDVVYPGQITGKRYYSSLLSLDEVKTYFGRPLSKLD